MLTKNRKKSVKIPDFNILKKTTTTKKKTRGDMVHRYLSTAFHVYSLHGFWEPRVHGRHQKRAWFNIWIPLVVHAVVWTTRGNKLYYVKIRSAFIRNCFSKLRLDGASKISSCNDECVWCGVERNTPHLMMDCILGSERRSQLKEKLITAFEGCEHLTKTKKMIYILNLSHNDEDIQQEMCKYI